MGNCLSDAQKKARSDAIDKQIDEDSMKLNQECKVLLLGSRESGKSTIMKQMMIHQNRFTEQELEEFRPIIYKNVLDSAHALVGAMWNLGMECENPANIAHVEKIMDFRIDPLNTYALTDGIADSIHELWQDPVIPQIMDKHTSEFYLMDSASYFFTEVHRLAGQEYVPSQTDVLHARIDSTGIVETRFTMGSLSIHMIDAGGLRSERKKWIHCFESVTSIIFCTALSEYDQVLLEEKVQNRMNESLVLFESVANSGWFLRTSIILFLNKIDVFRNKLPKVPLEKYFPKYTGGGDVNKATKYILWRFMQANRARLSVYPHITQASDTDVRLVFAAVKETILQNALKDRGIL